MGIVPRKILILRWSSLPVVPEVELTQSQTRPPAVAEVRTTKFTIPIPLPQDFLQNYFRFIVRENVKFFEAESFIYGFFSKIFLQKHFKLVIPLAFLSTLS